MVVVAVVVVIVVVVVQRGTGEGQTRAGRSSDRVFCCVRCWFLTLPVSTANQITGEELPSPIIEGKIRI